MNHSDIQEYVNKINNSRLISSRSSAINTINISKSNPFNQQLNTKIKDNVYNTVNQRRTGPVNNMRIAPGNNNIALYEVRSQYNTNAENVLGAPILTERLNTKRIQNVELEANARKYAKYGTDTYAINRLSGNSIKLASNDYEPKNKAINLEKIYNPMLPESSTNIKPKDLPAAVDERIERKRNEHEFLYDSQQTDLTLNMIKGQERLDRIKRQEANTKAFKHLDGRNRWGFDEHKYYINPVQEVKNIVDKYDNKNDRINIDDNGYMNRETFDSTTIKSNIGAIERLADTRQRYNRDNIRNEELVYKQMIEAAKKHNKESFDNSKVKPVGLIEGFTTNIIKTVKKFFGENTESYHKPVKIYARNSNTLASIKDFIQNDSICSEHFQELSKRNSNPIKIIINRNYDKPVVIDINDELSNTAAGIISLDKNVDIANDMKLKKTLAFMQDSKFIIIQQLEKDSIFSGDLNPIGNDLLITTIPVNELDKTFREHIDKLNPVKYERSKPLELTYSDYQDLTDWIEQHPDKQARMSLETALDNIRSLDYERDINNNFSSDSTVFVEANVNDKMTKVIRQRIQDKVKQRVTPAASMDSSAYITESYTDLNLKERNNKIKPKVTTQRSKKVKTIF